MYRVSCQILLTVHAPSCLSAHGELLPLLTAECLMVFSSFISSSAYCTVFTICARMLHCDASLHCDISDCYGLVFDFLRSSCADSETQALGQEQSFVFIGLASYICQKL